MFIVTHCNMQIKQIVIKVYWAGRHKRGRERDREIKKKDDISDTHKSTDQRRPTIVVGIKISFYQILVYWLQCNFKPINILMKANG